MENNEKAEYFAQYYGQEVLMYDDSEGDEFWEKQIYPVDAKNLQCRLDIMHIVLKPFSEITDEDAMEVARLYWNNAKPGDVNHTKKVLDTLIQKTNVADYVRSKGYAADWRNYSVEQLIEMEWLKLKP